MNNTHFSSRAATLAAIGLVSLGPSVRAQSSVTVFGIADLAARSVHNEGTSAARSLVSGSNSTSRIGFRGVEDLGDGLSAAFHLEAGVALDMGSSVVATQFFDRRATVSVASRTFGEVRAGRDYVPSYVSWTRFDPFGYVGVAGSNNMVSATSVGPIRSAFGTAANTTVRSTNSIQYLLPGNLGGVEGGLMVAAGEGAVAGSGTHKVMGVRLGYSGGPIVVSGGLTQTENSLTVADKFKRARRAELRDRWRSLLGPRPAGLRRPPVGFESISKLPIERPVLTTASFGLAAQKPPTPSACFAAQLR